MKEANFFLVVRFWIAPGGEEQVMRWIEGGHMAEVMRQPGFLWVRRLKVAGSRRHRLERARHDLRHRIARRHYDRYMGNHAAARQVRKGARAVRSKLRIERFAGEVDFSK